MAMPAREVQPTGAASGQSESRLRALHLVIPKSLFLGGLPTISAVQVRPRGWKNSMTGQPHQDAGLGKPDFCALRLQPAVRFTSLKGKSWPRILPKFGPYGPPFGAASFQEDFEGIPHLTAISILYGNKAFIATFFGVWQ